MLFNKLPRSVLIVSSSEKGSEMIAGMLDADSFAPVRFAKSGSAARRVMSADRFDVVIINAPLSDEFGNELALNATEDGVHGVILIVKTELFDETCGRVEDVGVLTVAKPISKMMFHQTMKLVAATCAKISSLERENGKLRVKIEEIKLIERAKWTLIEVLGMSEPQAHRYIEKQAMDMRMSKKEIALSVLKTYTNLTN